MKLALALVLALAAFAPLAAQSDRMVLVEGGKFTMGSKDGGADARPHTVTVSSFYMDRYKVTLSEWADVMKVWPVNYSGVHIWREQPPYEQYGEIPAFGVTWYEAVIYCNRLSVLEGYTPCYASNGSKDAVTYAQGFAKDSAAYRTGRGKVLPNVSCDWNADGYRLPTEAEWEYAARGGKNKSTYRYAGSDDYREVINLQMPYRIAQKKPNALGIHDMSLGPEWCWDLYGADYYKESSRSTDPRGAGSGEWDYVDGKWKSSGYAENRVLRGGFYNGERPEYGSEVYARASDRPESFEVVVGPTEYMFRVVRSAKPGASKKSIVVRRDVEAMITGVPYYYFMTDNYDAIRVELAGYGCRAPSGGELRSNPVLAQSVRSKMAELGACWSMTGDHGSGVLNYYTPDEGPYIIYLQDLKMK